MPSVLLLVTSPPLPDPLTNIRRRRAHAPPEQMIWMMYSTISRGTATGGMLLSTPMSKGLGDELYFADALKSCTSLPR